MAELTKKQNPRYIAFSNIGGAYNWDYISFIAQMKTLYANSRGMINTPANPAPIFDHDEFTDFINLNADLYKVEK